MKVLIGLIALTFFAGSLAQSGPQADLAIADGDPEELRQLTCIRASASPGPGAVITWHFSTDAGATDTEIWSSADGLSDDDTKWTGVLEGDVATLTILSITDTAGLYECRFDGASETPDRFVAEVIIVVGPTCDDPADATATEEVIFSCETTVDLEPTFAWDQFGATGGQPGTDTSASPIYTGTLTYDSAVASLFGDRHTCTVTYETTANPDTAVRTCSSVVALAGSTGGTGLTNDLAIADETEAVETRQLTCQRSDSTYNVEWLFDGESIWNSIAIPSPADPRYTISDPTTDDTTTLTIDTLDNTAGIYSCLVAGAEVGEAEVIIVDGPTCSVTPTLGTVSGNVEFRCETEIVSSATPAEPSASWEQDNALTSGVENNDYTDPDYWSTLTYTTATADVFDNVHTCTVTYATEATVAAATRSCAIDVQTAVFPNDPIVVLEETANSAFGCRREDVADELILYFTPYDGSSEEAMFFDANDDQVRPAAPWTVTPDAVDADVYTLTIDPVSLAVDAGTVTAGTYRCEVVPNGQTEDIGGSVEVVAVIAPVCDVNPGLGSETSFEQATFTCTVRANQPPDSVQWEFQWTQDGNDLTAEDPANTVGEDFIGSSISTLLVSVGDLAFDSQYDCDVTLSGSTFQGQCNDQVTLVEGLEAPQANSLEEGSQAADMVMLYCGLTDDPEAEVAWFFTPFNAADPEPVDTADDRWSVNQSELEAHVDGFVSELHITPVTAESEPFTAGSYSCAITPGGTQTDTIPVEAVTISTYEMTCRVDEDPAIQFVCEMQSSSDEVVWTDPQWAPEGGDPVEGTLEENVEGADSDFTIDQYSYTPAETVDTAGTTYTCSAQVGGQAVTCDAQHGGASHVQLSVGVMLAALLLSALRIF